MVNWTKGPWSRLHYFVLVFIQQYNTLFEYVNVVVQMYTFLFTLSDDMPINYSSLFWSHTTYIVDYIQEKAIKIIEVIKLYYWAKEFNWNARFFSSYIPNYKLRYLNGFQYRKNGFFVDFMIINVIVHYKKRVKFGRSIFTFICQRGKDSFDTGIQVMHIMIDL